MFLNHHTSNDRLKIFREFRQSQPNATEIVEAFANVHIQPRYVDYYTPDNWPNPFDIVQEGMFCQSGLTLIMTATLYHLGHVKSDKLKFIAVNNHITGKDGLVLVDHNECYNFLPGQVVSEQYVIENSIILDQHIIQPDKLFG